MSVIDDVVGSIGGVGVPLLPTVVGVSTTVFVVVDPPEAHNNDHYNQCHKL